MPPRRLPIVNADDGTWGDIIRQYLMKEHYNDDTDNTANGGHQKITIRPGTAAAGTAPLKFTSGTLLSTPEAGAVEFNGDNLYFTQTSGTTRKKLAAYDDASGATGDVYYRNSSGQFTRLAAGSTGDLLTIASGIPSWTADIVGKALDNTNTITVKDTNFTLQDDSDATKQLQFQLSGISTGTTRTLTIPNASGTIYVTGSTDVSVADGGTGRSTNTTAYGIIAAGTTATGAMQTIAPGTSGQFLKSAGASALASFASIQLSDLSDSSSVVTLTATQTLTNKTLTAPTIASFTNATHSHTNAAGGGQLDATTALDATGTKSSSTFLRGDNTWATPPNTTYSEIPSAEITTGTATTGRLISGRRAQEIVDKAVAASGDVTLSGVQTLTNKTINADNNTLTNIEVNNFKASAIITESESIGSNDNDTTLPTSAAVKDYADSVGSNSQAKFMTGTTATAGATTAKTVTLDAPWTTYTPVAGDWFIITYTSGQTASSPTLAINGGTAYPIRTPHDSGTNSSNTYASNGASHLLFFDGSSYRLPGATYNTTYSAIADAEIINTGSTAARLITGQRAETLMANEATNTRTLTNKTLTGPRIDQVNDSNGNNILDYVAIGSAVNRFYMTNQSVGNYPTFGVDGSDTNIGFTLAPKGSGPVRLFAGAGITPTIDVAGPDTNIDLNLKPKGSGTVTINGVDVVTLTATQTLTNKTLTTPSIASFTNATHTHTNAAGGGQLTPSTALSATGTPNSSTYLRGDNTWATITTGGDASTNTATSVDSEVALFSGTGGKTLKRATGTGIATLSSGVLSTTATTGSGSVVLATSPTITTPVLNGTVTGTGVATAATANLIPKWDANKNLFADNFIATYTSTATAAGTTTLTVASTQIQVFTGTSTQTVRLPTTSVIAGTQYRVINNSTGAVTVQSSGANTITVLAGGSSGLFTALQAAPTAAAHWDPQYWGSFIASGKAFNVSNSLTLAGTDGTTMTFPSSSDTVVTLTATQTLTNKTLTAPTIASFTNATHSHTNAAGGGQLDATTALDATGTKSSSTFLRGDNTWATPPNTTYSEIPSAEITTGTATTGRLISGRRAQEIVDKAVAASGDVTLSGVQTLTNKTLSSPIITSIAELNGTIDYTPDSGNVLTFDGTPVITRHLGGQNKSIGIGGDDTVIIGGGESRATIAANVNLASETVEIGGETGVSIHVSTDNWADWANRKTTAFTSTGITWDGNQVWHAGNDGSGSGLDADLLDGNHASVFATLTGTQTLTNKTLSGSNNTFSNIPISAVTGLGTDFSRLVVTTATGSTGTENGANTWTQIATFSTGTNQYSECQLILNVVNANSGAGDSAIVWVYFRTSSTSSNPTVDVRIIAKTGTGSAIASDSFKVISDGWSSDMQLWFRKGASYGRFNFYEAAQNSNGGTLTYASSPAWQSSTPSGSVNNVSSDGVYSGLPLTVNGTVSGTQLVSTVSTGTAPLSISSTTKVTNLNADLLDDMTSATSASGNTIVARDANADINARYVVGTYMNMSHSAATRNSDTVFYSSTDNYIRKNTATGFKTSLSLENVDNTSDATKNSATATLTNKTLTSPIINGTVLGSYSLNNPVINAIADTNGNFMVTFYAIPSAVNFLTIANATSSNSPILWAQGSATNIGLTLRPKGNGTIDIYAESGQTPTIQAVGASVNNDLNLKSGGTGKVKVNGTEVVTISDSQTITNKNFTSGTNTFPTFNQDTTGSAATLTTARTIALSGAATGTATSFNGSSNITIPVTALNANNLSAGTLPDARMTGTYTNFTHRLDGANTIFTTPNSGSTNNLGRTVYGLAEYRSNSSSQTGAIIFYAPNTTSSIMHQLEISGLLYNQNIVQITVQGYRTTGAWNDTRKISTGTVDVQVRWGVDPSGKNCLILGDVGTTWSYPHLSIVRAMFSHTGAGDSYATGWTVGVATDLSGYTQITSTISDSTMVGSISGNAATASTLQTARTIGGVSFNGSANINLPGVNTTGNQNTTGSAATLTTARTIQTNLASTSSQSFNGSANITPGVTGTLAVGNGGTGATTLTGIIKGNGTSAFTAATAGTDYVTPTGSETLTNKTLTTPTIASFTNATHTHTNAAGGGQLTATSALDATGTPSSSTYLRGDNTWATISTSSGDASTNTATSVDSEVALFAGTGGKTLKRATGTGLAKLVSGVLSIASGGTDYVTPDGSETLNNKRINSRIGSITSSSTPSINTNIYDQYNITALATNISSLSAAGSPVEGQKIIIRIKDNGSARSISWSASWRGMGVSLPVVTTASKTLYIGAIYNSTDSIWDVIAVEQQA